MQCPTMQSTRKINTVIPKRIHFDCMAAFASRIVISDNRPDTFGIVAVTVPPCRKTSKIVLGSAFPQLPGALSPWAQFAGSKLLINRFNRSKKRDPKQLEPISSGRTCSSIVQRNEMQCFRESSESLEGQRQGGTPWHNNTTQQYDCKGARARKISSEKIHQCASLDVKNANLA